MSHRHDNGQGSGATLSSPDVCDHDALPLHICPDISSAIVATPAPTATAPTAPPVLSPTSTLSVNPSPAPFFSPTAAPTKLQSHIGRSFTLGFMQHGRGELFLSKRAFYITGNSAGTGNVSIPGIDLFENFTVIPGELTPVILPARGTTAQRNNRFSQAGIRVDASTDIVLYGVNDIGTASADGFLGLPRETLGSSDIVLGYTSFGDLAYQASEFIVVGDEDDTVVTITPSVTSSTRTKGIPYNIRLDALEIYQLFSHGAGEDITDSVITSTKPVAVFSGASIAFVPVSVRFADHLVEQIPPTDTWGTTFFTVPIAQRKAGDVFRVLARDSDTDVIIDGVVVATLNATEFFEAELSSFTGHKIVTTRPSLVGQYNKGSSADDVETDHFLMLIPDSRQYLNSYMLTTPSEEPAGFPANFINLIVLTTDLDACKFDEAQLSTFYTSLGSIAINNSEYTGVQLNVTIGAHIVDCPNSFGAFVYGSDRAQSYGYLGGCALRKLGE